jgi:hypothetical protein
LAEIRAVHDMEKAANSDEEDKIIDSENSVNLTEEEENFDREINHEELQYLVKKLHIFAKLQLVKL